MGSSFNRIGHGATNAKIKVQVLYRPPAPGDSSENVRASSVSFQSVRSAVW